MCWKISLINSVNLRYFRYITNCEHFMKNNFLSHNISQMTKHHTWSIEGWWFIENVIAHAEIFPPTSNEQQKHVHYYIYMVIPLQALDTTVMSGFRSMYWNFTSKRTLSNQFFSMMFLRSKGYSLYKANKDLYFAVLMIV